MIAPIESQFGLPLSTTSREAASLYREAIERTHGAQAGARELLAQAITLDPAFAIAQAALSMHASAEGDAAAAASARHAAKLGSAAASTWERGHIECLAALIQGQPDAWQVAREHLATYPQDLLVATQLVGDLFFNGRRGKREAVMSVLRPLAPHHRDNWAFAARLGFHCSELGDPSTALELIGPALAARPQAPFVAHAMAHALLEAGDRTASYHFLRDWASCHDLTGPIDGHLHWHLSLGELEHGDPVAAAERYRRSTAPGASHCGLGLVVADAAGLFGRMTLDGAPLDGMPRAALHRLLAGLEGSLRFPFVAVHAAALAMVLDEAEVLRSIEAMHGAAEPESRVVTAFKAYLDRDMEACLDALAPDRPEAWEAVGGSNEERALFAKLLEKASQRLPRFQIQTPYE